MAGRLYVVAGPIGNLEDVTLRALRVLAEVDLVLAEDTRITRRLLSRYDIHTPIEACHAHTAPQRIAAFVELLRSGKSIALVTDAGTPGVSDPGDALVRAAVASGIEVTPIPGPSAVTAMISISAIPDGRYVFEGFPPRARAARTRFLERIQREERAVVLYESPVRVRATMQEIVTVLGDRRIAIGRELTKRFEEVYRGTLTGALLWLQQDRLRGEFTLVLYPPEDATMRVDEVSSHAALDQLIREALGNGLSTKEAAAYASIRTGVPRKKAYARALEIRCEGHADDGSGRITER